MVKKSKELMIAGLGFKNEAKEQEIEDFKYQNNE